MKCRIVLSCGALLAATPGARAATPLASPNLPAADSWIGTGGGSIRVLDKQKAQSRKIDLKIGQTVQFESLAITLRACMVHPPVLPPDQAGFLEIVDSREGEPGFHGWMMAHEPGVAMLESPVYGVRVVGCEAPTDAAIAAAMPQAAAPPTLNPPTLDPGAAVPGAPAPAVPLSPEPTQPLDATPPATIPAPPPAFLAAPAPPRPAAPASPAAPAAPASGGVY